MPLAPEKAALLKAVVVAPPYAGLGDEACRTLLNVPATIPGGTATRSVPLAEIQALGYRLGIIPRLEAALEGAAKVLARITLNLFTSKMDPVDVNDPAFGTMLDQLQAATLLSQEERAAIVALSVVALPDEAGPTPFQSIAGLGDVPLPLQDGTFSQGTCYAWMVTQARAS